MYCIWSRIYKIPCWWRSGFFLMLSLKWNPERLQIRWVNSERWSKFWELNSVLSYRMWTWAQLLLYLSIYKSLCVSQGDCKPQNLILAAYGLIQTSPTILQLWLEIPIPSEFSEPLRTLLCQCPLNPLLHYGHVDSTIFISAASLNKTS